MPRSSRAALRLVPAAALLLVGTADAQTARPADAAARLAQALDLTPEQQARLRASAESNLGQPGGSWAVAAEAARVLTPAQVAQIRARSTETRRGERPARATDARRDGTRPAEGRRLEGRRLEGRRLEGRRLEGRRAENGAARQRTDRPTRLSDAQQSALREATVAARERRLALVEQFRAGQISDEAFVAQSRALREQTAADVARIAPDARRADPLRAEAAREAALGLTAAQRAELERIRLDALRAAPARDGSARPTEADREARRTAMQAQRARIDAVYTPEQRAVVDVHRALVRGMRGARPAARPGTMTE